MASHHFNGIPLKNTFPSFSRSILVTHTIYYIPIDILFTILWVCEMCRNTKLTMLLSKQFNNVHLVIKFSCGHLSCPGQNGHNVWVSSGFTWKATLICIKMCVEFLNGVSRIRCILLSCRIVFIDFLRPFVTCWSLWEIYIIINTMCCLHISKVYFRTSVCPVH